MSKKQPFTIIIDTREQSPYTFGEIPIEVATLQAGDYSIKGMENVVAIERKSLNDYVNTVIHAQERFTNELYKLMSYHHTCIVVEGSVADIMSRKFKSAADPRAVMGKTHAIICNWKVPVMFCGDRQHSIEFCKGWFSFVWASVNQWKGSKDA
jgi:DNA excision repair protein ERCC-4